MYAKVLVNKIILLNSLVRNPFRNDSVMRAWYYTNELYHRISEWHLDHYLAKFDYRYNNRKIADGERTKKAIERTAGKRLMYRDPLHPEQ